MILLPGNRGLKKLSPKNEIGHLKGKTNAIANALKLTTGNNYDYRCRLYSAANMDKKLFHISLKM